MTLLLGFLPFLVFAVVSSLGYPTPALLAGAAVSAVWLLRDALLHRQPPKWLELGTFILFSALALYGYVVHMTWSIIGARIVVDSGLLVIILLSMAFGRPFTLQYARAHVAPERWQQPEFLRSNQVISAAWAAAFAVLVAADVALWRNLLPQRAAVLVMVGALYAALRFTRAYPRRGKHPAQS
ncbi:hypothetical protein [Dyella sp. C9]|uniref:hypothetical protein n=1 Tax=Dyella sp. C9 TaxID=2202154 RepID=UPI000DEF9853|nr:hypothetical protein [Dyella sp. C9]